MSMLLLITKTLVRMLGDMLMLRQGCELSV